jgi:membrane protein
VSFLLIAVLFGAIYKILPDRRMEWRDVMVGAVITALFFTVGKSLIGWYLGSSAVASSYGAAGALIVVLLWVYYNSEVFLLGAEFTRAYSLRHGSRAEICDPVLEASLSDTPKPASVAAAETEKLSSKSEFPVFGVLAVAGFVIALSQAFRRKPSPT